MKPLHPEFILITTMCLHETVFNAYYVVAVVVVEVVACPTHREYKYVSHPTAIGIGATHHHQPPQQSQLIYSPFINAPHL